MKKHLLLLLGLLMAITASAYKKTVKTYYDYEDSGVLGQHPWIHYHENWRVCVNCDERNRFMVTLAPKKPFKQVAECDWLGYELNRYFEYDEDTYGPGRIVIPSEVYTSFSTNELQPVERLAQGALYGSGLIVESIPDNLSIGREAFASCYLPDTLTLGPNIKCDDYAFFLTRGTKHLILETALTNYCFAASELESVDMQKCENSWVYTGAFALCKNLKTIMLSENIRGIKHTAFAGCKKLQHIYCPAQNPPKIEVKPFPGIEEYVNGVPTVHVAKGCVETYKKDEFWGQYNIVADESPEYMNKKYILSDGLYYIQDTYYWNQVKLSRPTMMTEEGNQFQYEQKNIHVPGSIVFEGETYYVTSIDNLSFQNNKNIETLTIDEGVRELSNYSFQNCTKLQSINLPASLKTMGTQTFNGCRNLKYIICNGKEPATATSNTFAGIYDDQSTLYVPAGCIDAYKAQSAYSKFRRYYELSRVEEYNGLYYRLDVAHSTCTLTRYKDETYQNIATYSGVVSVPSFAYFKLLPDDDREFLFYVTDIEPNTFQGCTGLTKLDMSKSMLLNDLPEYLCAGCTNLNIVMLNHNLVSIGDCAFLDTKNLKVLEIDCVTPPMLLNAGIFEGTNENCQLLVPEDKEMDYFDAGYPFRNINYIDMQEVVGIEDIESSATSRPATDAIFNLQGQRLSRMRKGLNIVNGRKILK